MDRRFESPIRGLVLRLDHVIDLAARIAFGIAQVILAAMALLVFTEVLCRALLGLSLLIVGEVIGYMLVATLFLGLSAAFRRGVLLQVSVLYDRLSPRLRRPADLFFNAACFLVSSTLTWQLLRLAQQSYERDVTSSTLAKIPLYIPQFIMAAGSVILTLTVLSLIVRALVGAPWQPPSSDHLD